MKQSACVCVALCALLLAAPGAGAVPSVTNVTATPRPDGSGVVDIVYSMVNAAEPQVAVVIDASSDGGAHWTITPSASALSGDVGTVVPGPGKKASWDTRCDLPSAVGSSFRVRVRADDRMIWIPAGPFLMGNNGNEPYKPTAELPQHSVYLSGYWIGKYEVTRGEYRRFMAATGRAAPRYWDAYQDWSSPYDDGNGFTQTEDHPVVGVTWYDAEAYCAWAGGHLPTEAQWEKAARWTGSYPNVYPWGNAWDAEKCNNFYDHNPAGGGYERYQTAPVGSYPSGASPYGLQDMAGNVWEWCRDWYSSGYYSVSPTTDPQGPSSGSYRVLRGGSWNLSSGSTYRCAGRLSFDPYYGWGINGFRLAR